MRPTSRLDAILLPPVSVEDPVAAAKERGRNLESGTDPLTPVVSNRGFRVDTPGIPVVYANKVGGFQARCPSCSTGLAAVFRPPAETRCPQCDRRLTWDEVICRPPIGVGTAAVVLFDLETALLEDPLHWQIVLCRR